MPDDRAVARVLGIALITNVGLAAAKIAGGRLCHSFALEADGWHSIGDGLTSAIALGGLLVAKRPADAKHPYGHRKFEVLAACAIGVLLLGLSGQVLGEAFQHAFVEKAHAPVVGLSILAILAATFAVNLALSIYEARAGARLGSTLLASDAKHVRADCYVTGGILVSALATRHGWHEADLVAAALVAVLIGKAGIDVIASNLRYLTDGALVDPRRIEAIVTRVANVRAAHSIRTRGTPGAIFVDLRVELPGELSVSEVHEILSVIEDELRARFDSITDVVIHPQPDKEQSHETEYARM
jgi:cation diffusion facilitator family transporter